MTDAEHWNRIKQIFSAALELAPSDRAAYVEQRCGGDAALRIDLMELLDAHDRAADFIEPPATPDARAFETEELSGQTIGPYRVLRKIGDGGMGTVYACVRTDDVYSKQVAIKVVRRGMGTEDVLRRFRHERQTLGNLDHPNIARLLDGGTTGDGRPYFVLDYVEGQPIHAYCDSRKLTIEERLTLFRTVCAAVHYAHQNLVVHRDIKPDNILVTADGVPKLVDFGIAKVLRPGAVEGAGLTRTPDERFLTYEYASPEQVRGEPITTATDIYSLGVVLYELLTGDRPYRLAGLGPREMERVICESDPVRPSIRVTEPAAGAQRPPGDPPEKLRRRLSGDLDTIVLMALRKEPQRRYASAEQFSEDLRRYIAGLPVMARQDTLRYRSTKFVRRHWGAVTAATLTAAALVFATGMTTWQAQVANAARDRAERRFDDVRRLANHYLFEFHDAIAELPGSTAARQLVTRRALEYLDSLATEAAGDPSLQLELATAYERVGELQWNRYYSHLGDLAGALESQQKALWIRQGLANTRPFDLTVQSALAGSHAMIGDLQIASGELEAALESYRAALALRRQVSARQPGDLDLRRALAIGLERIGDTLGNPRFRNLGDIQGALQHYREMQAIYEELVAARPDHALYRHTLSIGSEKLGDILQATGDLPGALAMHREGLAIRRDLAASTPQNARYLRDVAVGHGKVAAVYERMGDPDAARTHYLEMLTHRERLAAADPADARAQRDLLIGLAALGEFEARQGEHASARPRLEAALRLAEDLARLDPADREARGNVIRCLRGLADVTERTGHMAEARALVRRRLALERAEAERADATAADLRAYAWSLLTTRLPDWRDPAKALDYAERAHERGGHADPLVLDTLARAYYETGDHQRAVETVRQALAGAPEGTPLHATLQENLARFATALPPPARVP